MGINEIRFDLAVVRSVDLGAGRVVISDSENIVLIGKNRAS
jgi:hypothetical protein